MKSWLTFFIIFICTFTKAEPTPFETELPADKVSMVTCHPPVGDIPLIMTFNNDNDPNLRDNFHYRLYLPKGYYENPQKRYPILFIQDAQGNAKLGRMGSRMKRDGWIVAMLKEASNKSTNSINCFLAVHDDVIRRCRVAEGAKFLTGVSGGARNSSIYAMLRPGIRGIFMQAAGLVWGMKSGSQLQYEEYPTHIYMAGMFGNNDCNKVEGRKFHRRFEDLSRVKCSVVRKGIGGLQKSALTKLWIGWSVKYFLMNPNQFKKYQAVMECFSR